jgi:hypothetical protein
MKQGYFHFPLCLLAFGDDYKSRLQHIVSYCLCEQARRAHRNFANLPEKNALLDDAATFLNVTIASHPCTIDRWKEAIRFVFQWECQNGRDASVRIATLLLWEAYNNAGLSYREFSILCAINSIIGSRRSIPRRITEPSIRVRAAGFKSWETAKCSMPDLDLKRRLLTTHQVRYTLEKLHERKLFARARVGAKTVKYAVGISDAELRASLLQSETYHSRFKVERGEKDRELMIAIRAAKRGPH